MLSPDFRPRVHRLILRKVRSAIEESGAFRDVKRVAVGLSGGADSSVLLHLLADLHRKGGPLPVAVHVHHGMRGEEADRDAEVAERIANAHGVEFHLIRVRPAKGSLTNELSLRKLRLEALLKTAKSVKAERIALAHHQDDQAETFLLRLLTGTDVRGLGGMRFFRPPYWVRPLLSVSRAEIIQEAETCSLPFVHDSTNSMTSSRRNFLRKNIIPMLATQLNPRISEHLSHLARSFAQVSDFLAQESEKFLSGARIGEHRYKVAPFRKADEALRTYAIQVAYRAATESDAAALRRVQLKTVLHLIMTDGEERSFSLPRGIRAERARDWIRFGAK